MASDDERLVTLLEARITDFERNLKKANQTAGREFGGIRKSSKGATAQMEADMARSTARINQMLAGFSTKIGAYGKTMAGGFLAGIVGGGVTAIVANIGEVAKGIATIGDEAKRAGLSMTAFQELKFVAEQNRIGVDSLIDGMKELNLRADEFIVTGAGPAAEAFTRLGYTASDLKTKLRDPNALLLEMIGRLQQLDKAAQIRIADEVFGGTGGERFVELISQGEAGIRKTIARGHELGAVFDDELINKAAELDRKFNEVSVTVGNALKTAIVEAATALQGFVDKFRQLEKDRAEWQRMSDLGAEVGASVPPPGARLGNVRKPLDEGRFANAFGEELSQADQVLIEQLRNRYGELTLPDKGPVPDDKPLDDYFGEAERGGRTSEAERQAEAVRELVAELRHELDTMNLSDVQKRISNELRRAGVTAASEEGQEIARLVEKIESERLAREGARQAAEDQKQALEYQRDAYRELGDIAMDAGQSLANAFEDGKLSGQELIGILMQVMQQLLAMQGLGAIFGNIFSGLTGGGINYFKPGLYDTGGYTGPGPRKRPKGIVHAGEVVFSQDDVARHGGPAAVDNMRRNGPAPVPLAFPVASSTTQSVSMPFMPQISIGEVGNGVNRSELIELINRSITESFKQFERAMPGKVTESLRKIKQWGLAT